MKSFAPSSMPNQTITNGMSARCGTLRIICTLVSVAEKERRDRPFKRPSAKPTPPPTPSPARARSALTTRFCGNWPESVSRHAAAPTAVGEGMTVSAVQPSEAEACQATMMTTGRIHPIHGRLCSRTPGRRLAANSLGQTLTAGLSAISVNLIPRARPRRAAALGVALPRLDNVPDPDRRRNQPEPLEAVGDGLLLGEDVAIERSERELRSIDGSLLRSQINAARLRENGGNLIAVLVSPCRRRRDGAIDRGDYVRMLGGEVAIDQKE